MKNTEIIFNKITEIFSNGIILNHYSSSIMQDIGISLSDLKVVISEISQLNIKIQSIDSFHKKDKTLALIDFWYDDSWSSNYSKDLDRYLNLVTEDDNYLFSVRLLTDNPKSIELKIALDKLISEWVLVRK